MREKPGWVARHTQPDQGRTRPLGTHREQGSALQPPACGAALQPANRQPGRQRPRSSDPRARMSPAHGPSVADLGAGGGVCKPLGPCVVSPAPCTAASPGPAAALGVSDLRAQVCGPVLSVRPGGSGCSRLGLGAGRRGAQCRRARLSVAACRCRGPHSRDARGDRRRRDSRTSGTWGMGHVSCE